MWIRKSTYERLTRRIEALESKEYKRSRKEFNAELEAIGALTPRDVSNDVTDLRNRVHELENYLQVERVNWGTGFKKRRFMK